MTSRTRFLENIRFTALVLALGLIVPQLRADAQWESRGGLGSLHFMMVFPQGDFKKNVDDLGFGLSGDIGYAFPGLPLVAGLEGGWAAYGMKTYTVPLGNIKVVDVDVSTTNSLALAHLFARLQPDHGRFRPYIEGLLGLTYFNTSSSVTNKNTGQEVAGSTNRDDVAFSYGAGGGISYMVWDGSDAKEGKEPMQIFIDFRVRYFYGGEATYFRSDAVSIVNGDVVFDRTKEHTSKTDLLTPHIGVTFRF